MLFSWFICPGRTGFRSNFTTLVSSLSYTPGCFFAATTYSNKDQVSGLFKIGSGNLGGSWLSTGRWKGDFAVESGSSSITSMGPELSWTPPILPVVEKTVLPSFPVPNLHWSNYEVNRRNCCSGSFPYSIALFPGLTGWRSIKNAILTFTISFSPSFSGHNIAPRPRLIPPHMAQGRNSAIVGIS